MGEEGAASISLPWRRVAALLLGAAIGGMVGGVWGVAAGGLIGWVGSRFARPQADGANVRSVAERDRRAAGHVPERVWSQLPAEEQLDLAARWERKGEGQAARQIYWQLVERRYESPTPYERLADMYEEEGNDPQLIYVLDRAIDVFHRTHSDVLSNRHRQAILDTFKALRRSAIRRNNERYEA